MADDRELLASITAWGERRADVVALVLTGSRVRGPEGIDEFSDLDIEVYTTELARYQNLDWFGEFGDVLVCLPFDGDLTNRLVFYEGGQKVDFIVRDARHLADLSASPEPTFDQNWGRGYRFLVDKQGAREQLQSRSFEKLPPPEVTETEFRRVVDEFWFEAAHIPRYLLRGELWVVKFRDWTMKKDLLKMIEWHARGRYGDQYDTWHIGTKMKSWADSNTWAAVQETFGRLDSADSWRALVATIDLFQRLTDETAAAFDFERSSTARKVRPYVMSFAGRIRAIDTSSLDSGPDAS